ncbi:MAG: DUF4440 domain-containing protein [Methyloceanibacter sp.]|jgi:ketosteroid isomerase-like protein
MLVGILARPLQALVLASVLGACVLGAWVPAAAAEDDAAPAEIRAALMAWTADFNARRADTICDLFEPGLVADFRGLPEQHHADICARLRRVLGDDARGYHYAADIKEILVFGDVAVVRLVWTLTMTGGGETDEISVEPGLDLFRRQADGSWKIMRYMAFSR